MGNFRCHFCAIRCVIINRHLIVPMIQIGFITVYQCARKSKSVCGAVENHIKTISEGQVGVQLLKNIFFNDFT